MSSYMYKLRPQVELKESKYLQANFSLILDILQYCSLNSQYLSSAYNLRKSIHFKISFLDKTKQ